RSRRPDGRLRIPLPARAECGEPRRGERGARRARHLLPRIRAPSRPTVRKRWPDLAGPGDARRSREADARRDRLRRRARRALHHLARDRGLQLSVSDALRGELGLVRRRNRPGGRALPGAWNPALPRAQELGAGDEDPHAQRRDDAARDPQAPRAGRGQRQGQHGLATPPHERGEPRGVRSHARGGGSARPSACELGLGHLRRRQHGGSARIHGDTRARGRAPSCRLRRQRRTAGLRSVPVYGGRSGRHTAERAAVALHRLRRGADRRRRVASGARGKGRRRRVRARLRGTRRVTQLVGLDVGTTGVKALALSPEGDVLARVEESYELSTPHPGWAEQDPEDWWRAAERALAALGGQPAAIGLSGQMHGLVVLDDRDRVLRPAILWNDQRTEAECVEIEERVGLARLIQLTGNRALTGFTAPKLLWLRRHDPTTYAQVAHVLLPKDYVRLRLTGEHAIDVADASGTLLFDVARRRWSQEMLEALQLDPAWLPRALESPEVSGETVAGIPVAAGAGDQAAAALGVGVDRPGPVSVVLGTSGVVFAALPAFAAEPQARVHAFCHAVPGGWHAMGVMLSAGGSLRWLRDFLGADGYGELTAAAEHWPPGAEGLMFLPYLAGERTPHADPHAR